MVLVVHSDTGYLNKPNARSRAGEHFFLSNHATHLPNSKAILNIAQIVKHGMSSAQKQDWERFTSLQEKQFTSTTYSRQWATNNLQHQFKQIT